jgi:hypothetical protein
LVGVYVSLRDVPPIYIQNISTVCFLKQTHREILFFKTIQEGNNRKKKEARSKRRVRHFQYIIQTIGTLRRCFLDTGCPPFFAMVSCVDETAILIFGEENLF